MCECTFVTLVCEREVYQCLRGGHSKGNSWKFLDGGTANCKVLDARTLLAHTSPVSTECCRQDQTLLLPVSERCWHRLPLASPAFIAANRPSRHPEHLSASSHHRTDSIWQHDPEADPARIPTVAPLDRACNGAERLQIPLVSTRNLSRFHAGLVYMASAIENHLRPARCDVHVVCV